MESRRGQVSSPKAMDLPTANTQPRREISSLGKCGWGGRTRVGNAPDGGFERICSGRADNRRRYLLLFSD